MDAYKSGADALFILLGGIMILAMHAGFAFLELGTVRRKNQVNALVKILIDFAVSTIAYFFVGYGIADSRQGRGHATGAVTALLPIVRAAGFDGLTAETGVDNRASQIVLERNGFTRTGERTDPEDGDLYLWTIGLNDE